MLLNALEDRSLFERYVHLRQPKEQLAGPCATPHIRAAPFETVDVIPELDVFMEFKHQAIRCRQGLGIQFNLLCHQKHCMPSDLMTLAFL